MVAAGCEKRLDARNTAVWLDCSLLTSGSIFFSIFYLLALLAWKKNVLIRLTSLHHVKFLCQLQHSQFMWTPLGFSSCCLEQSCLYIFPTTFYADTLFLSVCFEPGDFTVKSLTCSVPVCELHSFPCWSCDYKSPRFCYGFLWFRFCFFFPHRMARLNT